MKALVLSLILSFLLTGCVSQYQKYVEETEPLITLKKEQILQLQGENQSLQDIANTSAKCELKKDGWDCKYSDGSTLNFELLHINPVMLTDEGKQTVIEKIEENNSAIQQLYADLGTINQNRENIRTQELAQNRAIAESLHNASLQIQQQNLMMQQSLQNQWNQMQLMQPRFTRCSADSFGNINCITY